MEWKGRGFFCSTLNFIPDGLEWNVKKEGFFVEWLSYFVLFNDRFSFAIQALTPTLFCRRPNYAAQIAKIVTYNVPLNIFYNYNRIR